MHWLRFSINSYWRQPLSSFFVVFALLAGCAGLSAVLIINAQAKASYRQVDYPLLTQVGATIEARDDNAPLTKADFVALRRAGFYQLVPMLERRLSLSSAEWPKPKALTVIGVDAVAALNWPSGDKARADNTLTGAEDAWQFPYRTLLHEDYATQLNIKDKQVLTLTKSKALPEISLVREQGLSQELLVDLGHLQYLTGLQHLTRLLVPPLSVAEINALKQHLPKHLLLVTMDTDSAQGLTDTFHLNLLAMGMMMFVVSLFVVMNAFSLVLLQRRDNLRVLRQLGVGQSRLLLQIGFEAMLLALVCAILGSHLGLWIAAQLSPAVFSTLSGLFDARVRFVELSNQAFLPQVVIMAILGTAAAVLLPMRHLSQQLAQVKIDESGRREWLPATLGLLLLSMALGLEVATDHMFRYLLQIALVLIGGALMMISLLPVIIRWTHNRISPDAALWHWASADSLRLSRGSKLAFCAFFLAVASNIGMNLMVDSFRQATNAWLSQRLIADFYLYSDTPEQIPSRLEAISTDIRLVPRLEADVMVTLGTRKTALPAQLYSYPQDEDYRQALLFKTTNPMHWQLFDRGKGVFISEQLQRKLGAALGDDIAVRQGDWAGHFSLAGTYYDYGNPRGQLMLPATTVANTRHQFSSFALHTTDESAVRRALRATDARLYSLNELMNGSMQAFDNTFEITAALNIITLGVAVLSLATSLLLLEQGNRAQWGLMRSLGTSKTKLLLTSLSQYGLLTLLTSVLAIPFGILLSALLVHKVNAQAFGWSYPLQLNPELIAAQGITSTLSILVCLLFPMFWFARQPLQRHLQWLR